MKKIFRNLFYNSIYNRNNLANMKIKIGELRQFPYKIEVIAEKLFVPWSIDISEDGRIYFTERSGSIRVIENGKLNPQPIFTFRSPFISSGEGGLLGLVLDPNHSQNHYIYVMHSYSEGVQIYNRVVRLIESNNKASIDKIIIDKIPGGQTHNGGRIKIGPDNKLYITTGDAGNTSLSQDLNSLAGKILRIELDGSIPYDNPLNNSPIYSYGHRNPQGLAWNSKNVLYSSEHGQTAHDEINIIKPGVNYGWPILQGDEESADIATQKPLLHSGDTTWAPSGITFVNQGPWNGNLLVATLRGKQLLSISLNGDGTQVRNVESWLVNEYGRLRDVFQGNDGSIYLATNNKDGRGTPDINDDRILRLTIK